MFGRERGTVPGPGSAEAVRWWAGIATLLPRGSLIPPTGPRLLRRVNEYRLGFGGGRAVFAYPDVSAEQARRLAKPTSSGLGDLLCAWMMPMALSELKGWEVRIPVPANAGGLHHDPSRPQISPDWLQATLALPAKIRLVASETAPDDTDWFCTLEQQWHLNSCMETSYDTVPWWLRDGIDRSEYYAAYERVARGLLGQAAPSDDQRPYFALHARRADRGRPDDDQALREIVAALAARHGACAVVSADPETVSMLHALLREANCEVREQPGPPTAESGGAEGVDARTLLLNDFRTLVGARAVVCSVRGGWSALPYAATRISGAPLVFTETLERSIVWRVIRAHSRVPVRGVHLGAAGIEEFLEQRSAAEPTARLSD